MRDFYKELLKRITYLDKCRDSVYFESESHAIAEKIEWAWRFRHITTDQMNQLCDMMININENKY